MSYEQRLNAIQTCFKSGVTQRYDFRKKQLIQLKKAILANEEAIYEALQKDLKKNREEAWITEIGATLAELSSTIKNLHSWMEPEKTGTNLLNFPSTSSIVSEPLGTVLIIGPWNYPFQLIFIPLIGAIAGGNCAVVKPSELAPATAVVVTKIIEEIIAPDYVFCVNGDGQTIVPALMASHRFDHVFYTGSTAVGKTVYKLAAETLTPVTLELGGKSPCIVESDANIKVAANRIAVAKFANAGQTCVAPDYILVHESKKQELIRQLQQNLQKFFGNNPQQSEGYGKIINEKQFDRIVGYLSQGAIAYGGHYDRATLYIAPTIIVDVKLQSDIMTEEIFGPVLPILSFTDKEEALAIINKNPDPLAVYIYTANKKKAMQWLQVIPAGGACINNCAFQTLNHYLPFGGRGTSGMGRYHGKYSFDTFTHKKAVLKTPTWFDPALKYPPFKGKLKLFKRIIK